MNSHNVETDFSVEGYHLNIKIKNLYQPRILMTRSYGQQKDDMSLTKPSQINNIGTRKTSFVLI